MQVADITSVTKLQGICKRSVIGSGGGTKKSTERGMGMRTEEAIRRLTDMGRTIAAQGMTTEEAGRNFIALEMAINALLEQERAKDDGK